MKRISQETLQKLVAEKGLNVTRGQKPKKKIENKSTPPSNNDMAKIVIASAKTVLEIAKNVNKSSENVSRATNNIGDLVKKMKPLDQKIEVIEKESGPKKCKFTIIRNRHTNLIDEIIKEEI
jgi:hypothetical protein